MFFFFWPLEAHKLFFFPPPTPTPYIIYFVFLDSLNPSWQCVWTVDIKVNLLKKSELFLWMFEKNEWP